MNANLVGCIVLACGLSAVAGILISAGTRSFFPFLIPLIFILTGAVLLERESRITTEEYKETFTVQLTDTNIPFIEDNGIVELGTVFSENLQENDVVTKTTTKTTSGFTKTQKYTVKYTLTKIEKE